MLKHLYYFLKYGLAGPELHRADELGFRLYDDRRRHVAVLEKRLRLNEAFVLSGQRLYSLIEALEVVFNYRTTAIILNSGGLYILHANDVVGLLEIFDAPGKEQGCETPSGFNRVPHTKLSAYANGRLLLVEGERHGHGIYNFHFINWNPVEEMLIKNIESYWHSSGYVPLWLYAHNGCLMLALIHVARH